MLPPLSLFRKMGCSKFWSCLRAPARLGVAHAPALDGSALTAAAVRSADLANHKLQHALFDVDVVVSGLNERVSLLGGRRAAGEGGESSLAVAMAMATASAGVRTYLTTTVYSIPFFLSG